VNLGYENGCLLGTVRFGANAIPVPDGSAWKNSLYASSPPAEAPIATTGKALLPIGASLTGGLFLPPEPDLEGLDFIIPYAGTYSSPQRLVPVLDAAKPEAIPNCSSQGLFFSSLGKRQHSRS
jgi:hypothetical protein